MKESLNVLFVEDNPLDAEIEERELRKAGFAFASRRVETADALRHALRDFKPDVVISDYSLPGMDGLDALRIVRETEKEIPFLFVSGTIGEERASESLKRGATDYIVKGRLGSLPAKFERALKEHEERLSRRRLEEQLRQSQKMEAIGRLAGGVAHDFNNLLTVINGYTEILLAQAPAETPMRADLEQVLGAGRRAAALTRQLLAFSRKQIVQPALIDLNAILTGLERMLGRLVGADVRLELRLSPDLHRIFADPGHIEQVVVNLVVNARDAMPRGGRIEIETSNGELPEDASGVRPGPCVLLRVRDSGEGMSQDVLDHLFEPFFTTKEPGKGTGLGLSTVHGIVRQSDGRIEVESAPGQGTVFSLYFPKAPQGREPERKAPASVPRLQGNETLLLAEDDDVVRLLCTQILASGGYRVLPARDGAEALRIAQERTDPLHLLLTDTIMPGIGGAELATRITGLRPGLRVLFMSGYTDREVQEAGALDPAFAFIQKPFTKNGLLQKIRELLDSP